MPLVKLKEFSDGIGEDLFHFQATADLGQLKTARGFGSAYSRELAAEKSISELVERIAFLEYGNQGKAYTSNGFAAHPNPEQAKRNAIFELYERDIVMTNWLTMKPPKWYPDDFVKHATSGVFEGIFRKLKNMDLQTEVGTWGQIGDVQIFVVALRSLKSNWGFSIATKAAHTLQLALPSLIEDTRRSASIMISHGHDRNSIPKTVTKITSPSDHRSYYFEKNNSAKCKWFFESSKLIQEITEPSIDIEEIQLNLNLPWELHICRASSNFLQQYFVGQPEPSKLNYSRIAISNTENLSLNPAPHPLA
jgi:hypothetical protein